MCLTQPVTSWTRPAVSSRRRKRQLAIQGTLRASSGLPRSGPGRGPPPPSPPDPIRRPTLPGESPSTPIALPWIPPFLLSVLVDMSQLDWDRSPARHCIWGSLIPITSAHSATTPLFRFHFQRLLWVEEGISHLFPFWQPPSPFPPQVAKAVTQALNRCVSCLPGQRDVDNALRAVGDASKRLLSDSVGGQGCGGNGMKRSKLLLPLDLSLTLPSRIYPLTLPAGPVPTSQCSCTRLSAAPLPILALTFSLTLQLPPSTGTFQEAQSRLNEAAAGLNQAATELVQASRGTPQDLARASGRFGQDFSTFLEAGVEMASQAPVRRGTGSGSRVRWEASAGPLSPDPLLAPSPPQTLAVLECLGQKIPFRDR